MLGPTVVVLDRPRAQNDVAIFEHGEWWRVAACNWLHAGIIHASLNMIALWCAALLSRAAASSRRRRRR